jgi:TPR repeat protein
VADIKCQEEIFMGQVGNQFQSSDGRWHDSANEANDWNLQSKAGGSFDAGSAMSDSAFQAATVGAAIAGGIILGRMGKAGKLQDEGLDLYKAGNIDGALKKFDDAIGKSKMASGISFALKGYIHYKKGETEKALATYKKGINSRAIIKEYMYAFRSELYAKTGDTEKATADCIEAVTGSYADAYNQMDGSIRDFLLLFGKDISGFEQRCFPLLKKAAESGNKWAYAGLAECYDQGYGVEKNEQEAKKWFAKSAKVGHLNGIYKTKGGKFSTIFLALFYTKAHIIVPLLLIIVGGVLTAGIGIIPAIIFLKIYGSRRIVKKLIPGYTGIRSLKNLRNN